MVQKKEPGFNTDQIATIVQGFVNLWIKFEAVLRDDLAKAQKGEKTSAVLDNQADDDYGLFYRVSSVVYPRKQMTMGDLSKALSVPFSKATRIVNGLVERGYVERLSDPGDRRVVLVTLTDAGKRLHKMIDIYTRKRVEELLGSRLTVEERMILLTLIHKVVSTLKQMTA